MNDITTFVHNVFIGLIALFPVINPIGTAFVVNPFFSNLSKQERKVTVLKIALYTLYLCVVTLFSGHWILQLFGLSIPVIQIAGGIMICKIGWDFLLGKADQSKTDVSSNQSESVADKLFYPLTFPMTAGAGTVSVLFTLSARAQGTGIKDYILNMSAILLAIVIMCVLIYVMYLNSNALIQRVGAKNEVVINRIVAFLIFCVGLQIASSGVMALVK